MKIFIFVLLFLASVPSHAQKKLSADVVIDQFQFQKPLMGVGKAGVLIFKSANVDNNGVILNIENVNNFFDSQIFIRPTFIGFTTQFGNYGFTLETESIFSDIISADLKNGKFILDDNQLNLSGEAFKFLNSNANVSLSRFRLYCQSIDGGVGPSADVVKNCMNYLTLNGSYKGAAEPALLEFSTQNKLTGDKTELVANVKSIDFRANLLSFNLENAKSSSNDVYFMNASKLELQCAKDPMINGLDRNKLVKDCLNDIKINPLKVKLVDQKAKTQFALDIKNVSVKNKIAQFALNSGALSDNKSTTSITDFNLNCKKETDSDLLELMDVLRDCNSYARISLAEVKSTKPDDNQGSSVKKIVINSDNNNLVIEADVKILLFKSRIKVFGKTTLDEAKRTFTINVTNTRLPFGLTSVKVLMYFLKKNLISKDVTYEGNNIIISL